MECCDKAISINPKLDKAWNNKGNNRFKLSFRFGFIKFK